MERGQGGEVQCARTAKSVARVSRHSMVAVLEPGIWSVVLLAGSARRRSALPEHFADAVWQKERMPTVTGLEIEGRHPQADGIRVEGAMQLTLSTLLIRRVRHGIPRSWPTPTRPSIPSSSGRPRSDGWEAPHPMKDLRRCFRRALGDG